MTPRFTAASAVALALLATTAAACTRSADDDLATENTGVTDPGRQAPPATAGMDDASPGTAAQSGAQASQPEAPPATGRADSYTDSGDAGAPDR